MIETKKEQLTTLGFGVPNLLKIGKVGYFPEQFSVDLGLQSKTALEIAKIDRECERLAKEKLELQLEIARIGG